MTDHVVFFFETTGSGYLSFFGVYYIISTTRWAQTLADDGILVRFRCEPLVLGKAGCLLIPIYPRTSGIDCWILENNACLALASPEPEDQQRAGW